MFFWNQIRKTKFIGDFFIIMACLMFIMDLIILLHILYKYTEFLAVLKDISWLSIVIVSILILMVALVFFLDTFEFKPFLASGCFLILIYNLFSDNTLILLIISGTIYLIFSFYNFVTCELKLTLLEKLVSSVFYKKKNFFLSNIFAFFLICCGLIGKS